MSRSASAELVQNAHFKKSVTSNPKIKGNWKQFIFKRDHLFSPCRYTTTWRNLTTDNSLQQFS